MHADSAHAAAVTRCGELLCWGNASDGKLGHGDRRKAAAEFPQRVVDLSGVRICAVACGAAHTVALTTQGKLYSWGRGANGRLGHGNSRTLWKPKLVDYFTEKGGWRRGLKSRTAGLGRKPVSESRPIVELAKGISRRFSLHSASGQREDSARGPTIAHVYAGLAFTMAISVDGNAYCFGAGEEGQCATPIATDALFPALVNTLAQRRVDEHIVMGAAGMYHAIVLCSNGDMYSWAIPNSVRLAQTACGSRFRRASLSILAFWRLATGW